MRQRYYSPQLKIVSPSEHPLNTQKLRAVGSSSQLFSRIEKNNSVQEIGPYVYNTNRQLGSGYSSKVYLGHKKSNNEEFAVKVIELKKYSKSNVQMLENQIEILKSLNHPNIVRVYDVFKNSEKCFIVTEYCPYGDLLGYISRRGKLSERSAVSIVEQVIEGYKYLISQKVLHRDIKPANIIKGRNNWKIADFGFSIKAQFEIKSQYNVGTPLYMPPQSLLNNIYSVKSDIFSIGVMLYQLVIGCTPWQSRTEKDLIKKMTHNPFKIPEKQFISEKMKKLLTHLCKINPLERMDKYEFLSLRLKEDKSQRVIPEVTQKRTFNTQIKRKPTLNQYRATSVENFKNQIQKISSLHIQPLKNMQSQSTNENQQEEDYEVKKKIKTKNSQILISQLNYAKFLHNLLQSCRNLPLSTVEEHYKLNLVLYKHLLKIMKHLSDANNNWFKLKQWQEFKKYTNYINIYLNIKELSPSYEKQYIGLLKNMSIPTVKDVNQQFNELSYTNSFSKKFYEKLLIYIGRIIRQGRDNIDKILSSNEGMLTPEISSSIQSLKSLYKYYKLIEMSSNQFQDYQHFQNNSDIKLHMEYRRISIHTVQGFLQLKNELKNI